MTRLLLLLVMPVSSSRRMIMGRADAGAVLHDASLAVRRPAVRPSESVIIGRMLLLLGW